MIKPKNQRIGNILAFGLIPLSGFATDIYIPSLPNMGQELHVGSLQVQLTLTVFLVSYGLSQIFVGSLLDSFGRYRFSLWALAIFTLASLLIGFTNNIYLIYLLRVIHGVTVALIVVGKRAYFVDLYNGLTLKNYLSLFTIIWSAGPIIAPFIGGFFESYFGWHANFYFLAAYGAVFGIFELIFSGETLANRSAFEFKKIVAIYVRMFKTIDFTLGILMLCLAYSMVMVYNMTGPYIIQHALRLGPISAGNASLTLGIAWLIGGFIGKATIERPFFKKLMFSSVLQVAVVVIMFVTSHWISNLYTLLGFAFLIHVAAGFVYNNYFTFCLSQFPQNAGIAGGLTGGSVYILLSLFTYCIISAIPARDEANLSISYAMLILPSALLMYFIFRKHRPLSIA